MTSRILKIRWEWRWLLSEMDFDSREEAEGARKLVEQAGLQLGTHGRQILQDELEENDGEGDKN